MKKVMILTGRYLPGYKDGGPVRTIKNVTDSIGDKYRFSVVCSDRDHGDTESYSDVHINEYNTVGNAEVFYVKDGNFSFGLIKRLAAEHDILYVCGPYNNYAIKAMILNRFNMIKCPLVLAPMGSFSEGALALKSFKKQLFLTLFRSLGLFNNIYFSVTSQVEEKELKQALNLKNKCFIAEDMPRKPLSEYNISKTRNGDELKIVFLSRICRKKNLSIAIDILSRVSEPIIFHVFGNIEDQEYWNECQNKLTKLPDNIKWKYMGELDSEKVVTTLSEYDVFLFPTMGENYGHVISEAMSAGCIPVISDTTPWLDLDEKSSGFVIHLYSESDNCDDAREASLRDFSEAITQLCKMTKEQLATFSDNARQYSVEKYQESINNNGYMEMFNELIR